MPQTDARPAFRFLDPNLRALHPLQTELVERLHLPVEGWRLSHDPDRGWSYRIHHSRYPIALDREQAADALPELPASFEGTLLLFGVGLGELVGAALERFPRARLVVWERDPWVLRQALAVRDWTEALGTGRVSLLLASDLVPFLERESHGAVVWHPLLSRVYLNERRLVLDGVGTRRALMCTGGLFVESFAEALRAEGYSVFTLDVKNIATEESDRAVELIRPEVLACVNSVNGLASFCERHDLDSITWEIDPTIDEPEPLETSSTRSHVFTFREANQEGFRAAGYSHVEYLPLGADPDQRRPLELDEAERERYGAAVSFVGSSMTANVGRFHTTFLEQFAAWGEFSGPGREVLNEVLVEQRRDLSTYRVPELLDRLAPGLRAHSLANGWADPAALVAEIAAAEKRLNYLAELGDLDIAVWGDEGFRRLEEHGVDYRGLAGHDLELPRIYNATTINLDIGRLYQSDVVTMRVFDVLACGGFVLVEHSEDLERLFRVGVEVESYQDLVELRTKIEYYLARPEEARAIAERGRAAVLERHTIRQRVQHMLRSFQGAPGARASSAA
jgi:spore maturation protein CgeB